MRGLNLGHPVGGLKIYLRPFLKCVIGSIMLALYVFPFLECRAKTNVVAWGAGTFVSHPPDFNNYGQSIVPNSATNTLTNATFVAGGWRHSLAIKAEGTLQAWGDDTIGQ